MYCRGQLQTNNLWIIYTQEKRRRAQKNIYEEIWRKRTINSFSDEFEIPPIISTLSPAFGRHRHRVFCVYRRTYTIYSKKKLNILFSFEKNENKIVCIEKEIIVWTSHTRLFILFGHNFLVCATLYCFNPCWATQVKPSRPSLWWWYDDRSRISTFLVLISIEHSLLRDLWTVSADHTTPDQIRTDSDIRHCRLELELESITN